MRQAGSELTSGYQAAPAIVVGSSSWLLFIHLSGETGGQDGRLGESEGQPPFMSYNKT